MELQRTIICIDDDGNNYEVEEWQEFIDAGHVQDPGARIPGIKELRLPDGRRVNFKEQSTFEIVDTGKIIRRT